jgi:UDPglucose 6-dehydrogenase
MELGIVGSGYVGTTVAACLADAGHDVVNVDVDEEVVDAVNDGRSPIHEDGLDELVAAHAGDRLRATTEHAALRDVDCVFLCLPTPSRDDGSIDLGPFASGVDAVAEALSGVDDPPIVVTKSTVVPGTNEEVVVPALDDAVDDVAVVMNPEFLREGSAVADFTDPDKVVVGGSDERALDVVERVYEPVVDAETPVVRTGLREAETIKYANNVFLATKVSLVNDVGNVCKELDVDTYEVMDAVGLDHRIGSAFLRSGLGWGGSCFPKDVDAFRAVARAEGYEPPVIDAAVTVNDGQPARMLDLLRRHVDVDGARVAVLGLSFKPGTDDVRNSRALDLIEALSEAGADVVAHDPVAIENARKQYPEVDFETETADALEGAEAAMIATGWPAYDDLDYAPMSRRVVIDGRRISVDREALDVYEGLCW